MLIHQFTVALVCKNKYTHHSILDADDKLINFVPINLSTFSPPRLNLTSKRCEAVSV